MHNMSSILMWLLVTVSLFLFAPVAASLFHVPSPVQVKHVVLFIDRDANNFYVPHTSQRYTVELAL